MAKLTKKLLLSYIVIVLFMGGLGVISILSLSKINQNGITMYENRVVPLSQLAEIAKLIENTRVQMVTSVNQKNPSFTDRAEENLTQINNLTKKYAQSPMTTEEKKMFDTFQANWKAYEGFMVKNMTIIRDGKYELLKEGAKEREALFSKASGNLSELIQINRKAAETLKTNNQQEFDQSKVFLILFLIASVILAIGVGLFVGRKIVPPIKTISEQAKKISTGDLTGEPIVVKNEDELGELAASFNEMNKNLKDVVSAVLHSSEELTTVSEELASSSEQVSASSREVATAMNHVAENTEMGNQSIVDVSKVLLELSSLIQIAKTKASSAQESSETTNKTALDGKGIVNDSIHKMEVIRNRTTETEVLIQKLDQYSKEIGQITQMITSIAEQTNLLALNASIEAARAGEQGRGFAVVADEVRKLAEQSTEGANQVAEIVQKISGDTEEAVNSIQKNRIEVEQGVDIVASAGEALDRILTDVAKTLQEVNGITDVTNEEVASSEKIIALIGKLSTAMESTAGSTQEVAASTEETTASMETVSDGAEDVSVMASELKKSVQLFKI